MPKTFEWSLQIMNLLNKLLQIFGILSFMIFPQAVSYNTFYNAYKHKEKLF
jgi:hypothetical protein